MLGLLEAFGTAMKRRGALLLLALALSAVSFVAPQVPQAPPLRVTRRSLGAAEAGARRRPFLRRLLTLRPGTLRSLKSARGLAVSPGGQVAAL